ncbi:hypothetical protein QUF64_00355 [Anaerolineales bacterium HSG6]|nr:hypothetical protein [Anaerolineales bacterium HSG6]MDM8529570.1 hypothetical protein [Anaerolineales bacterium HSG25]
MNNQTKQSWIPFLLFYLVLLLIISVLDKINDLLTIQYWGTQVALLTLGVGIFALVGYRVPDLQATASVMLAFTVGVLTIIPAIMMGLGDIPEFWNQYFSIAGGMAAGSFLTFLFLAFSDRVSKKKEAEKANPYEIDME